MKFSVLKRVMGYCKPYNRFFIAAIVSAIIQISLTLYGPILVGQAVDYSKTKRGRTGFPCQTGMKYHLCHRKNIQNLMDPHKLMRIPAGKLRHHLFFKGGKKIQAFHEKRITFYSSAVVLHSFCDRHIQFFPGHPPLPDPQKAGHTGVSAPFSRLPDRRQSNQRQTASQPYGLRNNRSHRQNRHSQKHKAGHLAA